MLRGVSFSGINLEQFLKCLYDVLCNSNYKWYIDDVELNYCFFREGIYTSMELEECLNELGTLSFARIRRYTIHASVENIEEYMDYVNSECDILILFYDGGMFDVYAKNEKMTHDIYEFCTKNNLSGTVYIDDATDCRHSMHF